MQRRQGILTSMSPKVVLLSEKILNKYKVFPSPLLCDQILLCNEGNNTIVSWA